MTADEGEAFFGKCYNCGELGHPWCDCKKPLKPALRLALNSELKRKAQLKEKKKLNPNGGTGAKGGCIPKAPRDQWLGLENVGQTLIDGDPVPALINNGARVNTVTPAFVKKRGLVVGSIADLNKHRRRIPVSCSGGYYTELIGYVMVRVQFPGSPSYDEDQVTLVIRDGSEFSRRVPVIIGTPTIDRVVQALKESEMDTVQRAHEYVNGFFVRSMNPTEPYPTNPTNTNQNPLDLNEKVFLKNKCTIPGFESMVVQARTHWTMMIGYCLNIITQAPYVEDRANLPVGVYMIPTYSELRDGSQSVAVVLRNLMGKPVHLSSG